MCGPARQRSQSQLLRVGTELVRLGTEIAHDGLMHEITIRDSGIRLGQFLKLADAVEVGSDVKLLLAMETVLVNGEPENRRGRQLLRGDVITVRSKQFRVC